VRALKVLANELLQEAGREEHNALRKDATHKSISVNNFSEMQFAVRHWASTGRLVPVEIGSPRAGIHKL